MRLVPQPDNLEHGLSGQVVVQATEIRLERPRRRRKGSCREQWRGLNIDDRNPERSGDGVAERAEDAEANHRVRVAARVVRIVRHCSHDGADHFPDRADRLQRVGSTLLHERSPGLARHDPLHVAAERAKLNALLLRELGEIFGRSQTHAIPALPQPETQDDTRLDVAPGTCSKHGDSHVVYRIAVPAGQCQHAPLTGSLTVESG
jgi:hypothetical protein